jgi:hypothetical protein
MERNMPEICEEYFGNDETYFDIVGDMTNEVWDHDNSTDYAIELMKIRLSNEPDNPVYLQYMIFNAALKGDRKLASETYKYFIELHGELNLNRYVPAGIKNLKEWLTIN